ncbi:hypothetical protein [Hwangdonia lutea]|uniref:Uncharacterized protein n=1 Tax=Hwangdonia lutea TaxID=3075823 RepID=A0AA97EPL9_9FLAO|nr:hypothetical protein [Hwangdonia sp. SCSIO 19198]WOD43823.1 hypothetical protein RNZ46_00850 [Hwangdonia sp. SCSIO 19198]
MEKHKHLILTIRKAMQEIINLLDVIIWPLTVLLGLLFFRKHIGKVISSLGSIKAGAQGFEMNFIEDKLKEATKLIGIDSTGITAKDGSSIIPKDGGSIIPKDSKITPKKSHAETPYQALLELQDTINQKLKNIAAQKGITTNSASNFALTTHLAEHNIINNQTARQLKTLIELNNMGLNSPKITYNQVIQMKTLFNNISL